jgi:hypothetical protein
MNFTIKELCVTKTGIHNEPNQEQKENLQALIENVLQPAREALGIIIVTSGFRNARVNAAVNGSRSSQHMKGEAADCVHKDNAALFHWIKDNVEFDQLIWEFGTDKNPDWVHVSYESSGKQRKQILKAIRVNGKTSYALYGK